MQIQTMLANKGNYGKKRLTSDIKYIVMHYTANDGDSARNNCIYYRDNVKKASAHYYCDDNSIWQSVPDDYVAWSVGGKKYANTKGGRLHGVATNSNTISIEICDTLRNGVIYPTAKTLDNAVNLCKMLMVKYKVPASRVIRHYDVTGKLCPAYWLDDTRWNNEFLTRISSNIAQTTVGKEEPIKGSVAVANAKYRVNERELNIRKGPGIGYDIAGVIKDGGVYTIVEVYGTWGKLLSGAGWINISSKYCTKL